MSESNESHVPSATEKRDAQLIRAVQLLKKKGAYDEAYSAHTCLFIAFYITQTLPHCSPNFTAYVWDELKKPRRISELKALQHVAESHRKVVLELELARSIHTFLHTLVIRKIQRQKTKNGKKPSMFRRSSPADNLFLGPLTDELHVKE